jgi:hypothetical protein
MGVSRACWYVGCIMRGVEVEERWEQAESGGSGEWRLPHLWGLHLRHEHCR